MNRLMIAALLLPLLAATAHAQGSIPADETFCRGIGLMTSSLTQRLQHGEGQEQAITAVLQETGAPASDNGPRHFLENVVSLTKTWQLDADTSGQLLYLSCWHGGLFGDAVAQKNYQQHLPAYLTTARQCAANEAKTGKDEKLRCLGLIFSH